jgi:hypothetical protein
MPQCHPANEHGLSLVLASVHYDWYCWCRSEYARSEMGDGSAVGGSGSTDDPGPEFDLLPDLPPSWVPKLVVSRDMMDMRCPRVRGLCEHSRCLYHNMHAMLAHLQYPARIRGRVSGGHNAYELAS